MGNKDLKYQNDDYEDDDLDGTDYEDDGAEDQEDTSGQFDDYDDDMEDAEDDDDLTDDDDDETDNEDDLDDWDDEDDLDDDLDLFDDDDDDLDLFDNEDDDLEWSDLDDEEDTDLDDEDDWEDVEDDPDDELDTYDSDLTDANEGDDMEDTHSLNNATDDDKTALIKRLRKENATHRRRNRDLEDVIEQTVNESVAELMTSLATEIGVEQTKELDWDDLTTQFHETIANTTKQAALAKQELAVYKAAQKLGADPARLADSRTFTKALSDLDPTAETYADDVAAAVKAAVTANPSFKEPAKMDRFGGSFNGGTPKTADPANMSIEELQQRRRERRAKNTH